MLNYHIFKTIQSGNLLIRRWSMRLALLTVGANLWVDHIIKFLLTESEIWTHEIKTYLKDSYIQSIVKSWGEFDLMESVNFLEKIIYILVIISLIASVLMWGHILRALIFLIADYYVVYTERRHRQWFWVIILFINMIVFYQLYLFWWP